MGSTSFFDDYTRKLFLAEEEKSEKYVNFWRIGISIMFFGVTAAVAKEVPHNSLIALVVGSIGYFLFSIWMFFYLRAGKYTPPLKYITIFLDIMIITVVMYSFGTFRTFKTEAFLLYFIWIAFASMRLSDRLTLFAGILSEVCYISLVVIALVQGTIETGTITEHFTSPKVSMLNQWLRVLYMFIVIVGVTYGSRAYRQLANESRKQQIEAEMQRMRTQRLESIGYLAGGIAHDFNNILAIITNNISIAKMLVPSDSNALRKLDAAESAALRATDLTRQFLTFSKGGAPIKKAASLKRILSEAVGLMSLGSASTCEVELPDGLHAVEVDEGQMHQVVNNLLINAFQATGAGGSVRVTASNMSLSTDRGSLKAGDYVMFSVADDGCGIPEENLHRIFDPYFTTKTTGSGLGLATSYSIMQGHGGTIEVESKEGKGTTFRVYLPASDKPLKGQDREDAAIAKGLWKILVMDDEREFRVSVAEALALLGHKVQQAAEGGEAIAMYSEAMKIGAPYDVVIMDLTVPAGMGGREAVAKLKEMDPDVRAIMVSGYSDDPVMSEYRKYGFVSMLAKPFEMRDLVGTISSAISATVS